MTKYKKMFYVFIGQLFLLITTILTTKIIIISLNKNDSAEYFITISYITILSALFISPLIQRYLQVKSQLKKQDFILIENIIKLINTISVFMVLLLLFFNFIFEAIVFLVLCCELNKAAIFAKFNILDQRNLYAKHSGIILFSRVFLMYVFIYVLNFDDINYVFSIWALSILISIFIENKKVSNVFVFKIFKCSIKNELLPLFLYCVPLAGSALLSLGREQIPRYIFLFDGKLNYISDYSALILISTLFPISLQLLITTIISPIISREYLIDSRKTDKKLILISCVFFASTCLVSFFIKSYSDFFITLILSNKYLFLNDYISFVFLGYGFFVTGNILTIRFFAFSKTKILLLINFLVSLIALFLYVVLYFSFGFKGITISLSVSNLIFFIMSVWFFYEEKVKENKVIYSCKQ